MFLLFLRLTALVSLVFSLALTGLFGLRAADPRPLLAFARIGPPSNLWLRDLDAAREYRLPGTDGGLSPIWSPDGRWLAYVRRLPDGFGSLNAFNLTTGSNQYVTTDPTLSRPVWSPDGRWLVVYSGDETSITLSFAPVTENVVAGMALLARARPGAVWSPEGSALFYQQVTGAVVSLPPGCFGQSACPDRQIIQPERPVTALLGWLPDGRLMVSSPLEEAGRPYLYGLNPQTGQMSPFLADPPLTLPAWSPDGSALAAPLLKTEDYGLFMVKTEVPELVLIDGQSGAETLIWDGVSGQLGWSPDGNRLTFEATIARPSQQYRALQLYDRRAGTVTRLTANGVVEATPAWGVFRGRDFAGGVLLALDGVILGLLIVLRVVHPSHV